MRKIFFLFIVAIIVLSGCKISKSSLETEPEKFLTYANKTESSVYIDCNVDSDCKLIEYDFNGCDVFIVVNIDNLKEEIETYITTQNEIAKNAVMSCSDINIKSFKPVCEENVCTAGR